MIWAIAWWGLASFSFEMQRLILTNAVIYLTSVRAFVAMGGTIAVKLRIVIGRSLHVIASEIVNQNKEAANHNQHKGENLDKWEVLEVFDFQNN